MTRTLADSFLTASIIFDRYKELDSALRQAKRAEGTDPLVFGQYDYLRVQIAEEFRDLVDKAYD